MVVAPMSQNPYAPPAAQVDPSANTLAVEDYQVASTRRRFANMLIDVVGYYALAFCIGIGLGLVDGLELVEVAGGYPFGCLVVFLYYFPQELAFNRTLGKLVTGTKVISSDNRPLTAARIAGRTISRMVPFDAFSFLGSSPGWHDQWSKTRVVLVNRSGVAD